MLLRILIVQHAADESPGLLRSELERQNISYEIVHPYRGEPFKALDAFTHLIVMGGHMGVNDHSKYPWIQEELELIRKSIRADRPVLGICLGAQMIAAALGKPVRKHDVPELGWVPLKLTDQGRSDPVLKHVLQQPRMFQWHYDTFELPDEAVLLASSAACLNQAFRYKQNVYGLQFHPEVDALLLKLWSQDPEAVQEAHPHAPFDELIQTAMEVQDLNRSFIQEFLATFLGTRKAR